MKKSVSIICILLLPLLFSCDETPSGPNELGGDTNLELTKVGNEFGVSVRPKLGYNQGLENLTDSIFISKNENGIVTFSGTITIDSESLLAIDTLLGTQTMPKETKLQIMDNYLGKYGFTIDSSNHEELKLFVNIKFKITSEGVQDFTYSKGDISKPFTMVKYSSKVGDKYEFKTSDGETITRTVIQTHTVEDWDLAFWSVKTTRVEQEIKDDPVVKKVTFIGNHKFGLVGAIYELKDGKIMEVRILPWELL